MISLVNDKENGSEEWFETLLVALPNKVASYTCILHAVLRNWRAAVQTMYLQDAMF